jgi:TrmH family RNA methyltransferase
MGGVNIYKTTLPQEGVVVMGNEANGISKELEALIKNKLSIPRFGNPKNGKFKCVAAATAIVLSEFRR